MKNDSERQIITCGESFGDLDFVKAAMPDGSSFGESTSAVAGVIDDSENILPLKVTSKGCVLFSSKSIPKSSWIYIQAVKSGAVYSALNPAEKTVTYAEVKLSPSTRSRFEFNCPLQIHSAMTNVAFNIESANNDNHYVLRYKIMKDAETIGEKQIVQPRGLVASLSSRDSKVLPDGRYALEVMLFDLDQDFALENPSIRKTCEVFLDRSAPESFEPFFGRLQFDFEGQSIAQVDPASPIMFEHAKDFLGEFFFCLEEISDPKEISNTKCGNRESFAKTSTNTFLPREGFWRFHYFARDLAGNESAIEQKNIVVINLLSIEQIKNLLNASVTVAKFASEEALGMVVSAVTTFSGLVTDLEKSLLRQSVRNALLATGLQESAVTIPSRNEYVRSLRFSADGSELYSLHDGVMEVFDRKTLKSVPRGPYFDRTDFVHDRFYDLEDGQLRVLTSGNKLISQTPLTWQGGLYSFQVSDDGRFVLFGSGHNDFLLIENDSKFTHFSNGKGYQTYNLLNDGRIKFASLDEEKFTATEEIVFVENGSVLEQSRVHFDLDDECFKGSSSSSYLQYSPKGNYLLVTNAVFPLGVVSLDGKTIVCSEGGRFDHFVFASNDNNLVYIRNLHPLIGDLRAQFRYKLYSLSESEGVRMLDESIDLEDNCFQVTYLPNDRLLLSSNSGLQIVVDFFGIVTGKFKLGRVDRPQLAVAPDGKEIVFKTDESYIFWKPGDSIAKDRLSLPLMRDFTVLGRSGRVSYTKDGRVFVTDPTQKEAKFVTEIEESPEEVSFSPSGKRLLVKTYEKHEITVFNLENGDHFRVGENFVSSAWAGESSIVTTDTKGQVHSFALTENGYVEDATDFCENDSGGSFIVNKTGENLYTVCAGKQIRHWIRRDDSWHFVKATKSDYHFFFDGISESGDKVYGSTGGRPFVWGRQFESILPMDPGYNVKGFVSDQEILLLNGGESGIWIMNVGSGLKKKIVEFDQDFLTMKFDSKNGLIAASFVGGSIILYDIQGKVVGEFRSDAIGKRTSGAFYGLENFAFQDNQLWIELPDSIVSVHLTAKDILSRYCQLSVNKDCPATLDF